jgi:peptidoglycan/xylan/chitin deacetylase (PgdA/CDA1 family)
MVLKDGALAFCAALGRLRRLPGTSVLVYHSIDDSGSYASTRLDMFRAQMRWLKDNGYTAVSMRRFLEAGARVEDSGRTVILTFDDGLANFAEAAWPVLREISFSATAYVATAFIGSEASWYAEHDLPRLACMDWDALRTVRREGADVQSHARSHRDLTKLSIDELRDELRGSRAALEDGLGDRVEHLAYPFGEASPLVEREAREAGYRTAVVLGGGRWRADGDPYRIPRDGLNRIAIRSARTARLSIEACARGTFGLYTETKYRVRKLCGASPPHLRRH